MCFIERSPVVGARVHAMREIEGVVRPIGADLEATVARRLRDNRTRLRGRRPPGAVRGSKRLWGLSSCICHLAARVTRFCVELDDEFVGKRGADDLWGLAGCAQPSIECLEVFIVHADAVGDHIKDGAPRRARQQWIVGPRGVRYRRREAPDYRTLRSPCY